MTNTPHIATSSNQLNKLRASVLGANDGIVSTAGLVLGVTGAAASKETILLAGFAGLVAGALSMAAGEFVSVSSQRDSEKAFLNHFKLQDKDAFHELTRIYQQKGLSQETALQAAKEIQQQGSLTYELEKEFGIDPDDLNNPWSATLASAVAFIVGAAIPLTAIILAPSSLQLIATIGAVLVSLILTGILSAKAGQASTTRATIRVVGWGIGAMAITYVIGHFIGVSVG